VDAVLQVAEEDNGSYEVDLDMIKLEKKPGGSLNDTVLIKGLVIDKEVVHSDMPKMYKDAKIGLLNAALEIEKTERTLRLVSLTQLLKLKKQSSTQKSTSKAHQKCRLILIRRRTCSAIWSRR